MEVKEQKCVQVPVEQVLAREYLEGKLVELSFLFVPLGNFLGKINIRNVSKIEAPISIPAPKEFSVPKSLTASSFYRSTSS